MMTLPPIQYTPPFGKASGDRVSVLYRVNAALAERLIAGLHEFIEQDRPLVQYEQRAALQRQIDELPDNTRGQFRAGELQKEVDKLTALGCPDEKPAVSPLDGVAKVAQVVGGIIVAVRVGESTHYVPASQDEAVRFWSEFSARQLGEILSGVAQGAYDTDLPKP